MVWFVSCQPTGQRVEEKLAWAMDFIRPYASDPDFTDRIRAFAIDLST